MDAAKDLAVLEAMAGELGDYLLAEPLLWQMRAPSHFPRLSLGLMLLTRARAEAGGDSPALARAATRIETHLARWRVTAEKKAGRELHMRCNLWRQFLEEARDHPRAARDEYPSAVQQRVIAALLLQTFPLLAAEAAAQSLPPLDAQLRARWETGDFVWDDSLRAAFPPDTYWFLYGRPRLDPRPARAQPHDLG